jgi:hypothetical protein
VVVAAPLDNVRGGLAIDLEIGDKVPTEVCCSDYNETSGRLTRSFARRNSGDEDKNKNTFTDVAS